MREWPARRGPRGWVVASIAVSVAVGAAMAAAAVAAGAGLATAGAAGAEKRETTAPIGAEKRETAAPIGAEKRETAAPIGVILALDAHLAGVERALEDGSRTEERVWGRRFVRGVLAGRPVVAVRARRGKIEMAATAAFLVARYRPAVIVSVAPAGALDAAIGRGELVVARRAVEHDVGTLGASGGLTAGRGESREWVLDGRMIEQAERAAAVAGLAARVGSVATGDAFVADRGQARAIAARTRASALDTSAAAVASVAAAAAIPALVARVVTDDAGENAGRLFATAVRDDDSAARVAGFLERLIGGLAEGGER